MLILGLETSCDDTAAAVLRVQSDGQAGLPTKVEILADLVQSQAATHLPYGGVVPELASRRHLENIVPVTEAVLAKAGIELAAVDLLAATRGPGLVGSLLVGFNFAKALSLAARIPLVGVDHIAGHLASVFLGERQPTFPHLALTASGGHSSLFLVDSPTSCQVVGRTRDDAAGEAFDKVAKLLGLGYPGGPEISRRAAAGDPSAYDFPRARLKTEGFDFSFSGLKTAVAGQVQQHPPAGAQELADLCASFQEAVVAALVNQTLAAAAHFAVREVVIGGGVAANPRLRQSLSQAARQRGIRVLLPRQRFCTDNAAMIALAGFFYRHQAGFDPDGDVYSRPAINQLPRPSGQGV